MPGGCRFGSSCSFYHEREKSPEREVCQYFMAHSRCGFGDKCRFIHTLQPKRNRENIQDSEAKKHEKSDLRKSSDVTLPKETHSHSENSGQEWKKKNSYICGDCSKEFIGKDAYDELHRHNMDMLCKLDKAHMTPLSTNHWFDKSVTCGACGRDFARDRDLLNHIVSKTKVIKQKRDQHHYLLEEVTKAFTDYNVGLSIQNESRGKLLRHLTNQMESEKDTNSSGPDMMSDDCYDELEERCDNFGFLEREVHELLSYGVKPWDDEARSFLEDLHRQFDEHDRYYNLSD